jgi:GDP-mannose 6-dehydrogenase
LKIAIFGLGYVGTVTAACLSKAGHTVIGCDVQGDKVAALNNFVSPVQEPGLHELIAGAKGTGRLSGTMDVMEAVSGSQISFVCVGTPSDEHGNVNTRYLVSACREIGESVRRLNRTHTVVIRSTVLPEQLLNDVVPCLIEAGQDSDLLRICGHPEFLREGTAIRDFDDPPMIVVGERRPGDGDDLVELYRDSKAPLFRLGLKEASMIKYSCNIFHALKVVFGNEIGQLCQAMGVDSHQVMRVFCQDRQLNISPAYLVPGGPFGGSCLPKDLRAALAFGRKMHVDSRLLTSIAESNRLHIERCIDAILSTKQQNIGVLGVSFKPDTDDLRESPTVEIIERLVGKGKHIVLHDEEVASNRIFGSNLTYIRQHLPHLATLMRDDPDQVIRESTTVVIAKSSKGYAHAANTMRAEQTLVDLVRLVNPGEFKACRLIGLVG